MVFNVRSKVAKHPARLMQANCSDDQAPVYKTRHDGTEQMNVGELSTCRSIRNWPAMVMMCCSCGTTAFPYTINGHTSVHKTSIQQLFFQRLTRIYSFYDQFSNSVYHGYDGLPPSMKNHNIVPTLQHVECRKSGFYSLDFCNMSDQTTVIQTE